MASRTLAHIMKHWTGDVADGYTALPFNIEAFCRENDLLLSSPPGELAAAIEELVTAGEVFRGLYGMSAVGCAAQEQQLTTVFRALDRVRAARGGGG